MTTADPSSEQYFNPYGLFNGIWVPDAMLTYKSLSPGAKLTYARLTRYAGKDGNCYPSIPTLAAEVGVSVRQAQRYLSELETESFIRRVGRFVGNTQTSSEFRFVRHPIFAGVVEAKDTGCQLRHHPVTDVSPPPVTDVSPKEIKPLRESRKIEEQRCTADSLPQNRKNGDSAPARIYPLIANWDRSYEAQIRILAFGVVGDAPPDGWEHSCAMQARGADLKSIESMLVRVGRRFKRKPPTDPWNYLLRCAGSEFGIASLPEQPAAERPEYRMSPAEIDSFTGAIA